MDKQRDYWDRLAAKPLDASVIDPNDHRGEKNFYLAGLRNQLVLRQLTHLPESDIVLDLGCGTGGLTQALASSGHAVLGLDISFGLLQRTKDRRYDMPVAFACYDGASLPILDESVDALTTYVVLTHIIPDEDLSTLLKECYRALKPDAVMVCIEQCRRKEKIDREGWKHFRTRNQWVSAFQKAGFTVQTFEAVRFGRFPLTLLIRSGMIPRFLYGATSRLERLLGRVVTTLPSDYCDMQFVLIKPKQ